MHHVWNVPELVTMVFEFLRPGDLARLARSCQSFFVPACEILWSRISDIQLLSLYRCIQTDPAATTVTALQDGLPHWRLYTRSVRHIIYDNTDESTDHLDLIDFATMALVTASPHPTRLLPNLTALFISRHTCTDLEATLSSWSMLFVPSLKTVSMSIHFTSLFMDGQEKKVMHFFLMLRTGSPALVDLEIYGLERGDCSAELIDSICNLLSGLCLLERFLGGLWINERSVLGTLGRLPVLSKLEIIPDFTELPEIQLERPADLPTTDSSSLVAGGFDCLRRLSISSGLRDCVALLGSLQDITDIRVTTWVDSTPISIGEIIGTRFPALLRLQWEHNGRESVATARMFRDNLFGLVPCRKLTHLVFRMAYTDDSKFIDDTDISLILPSWPSLRVFQLKMVSSSLSLQSLISFAVHCPSLEHLVLDMRAIRPISLPPRTESMKHKICLELTWSARLLPLHAALVIYSLWPNARLHCNMDFTRYKEVQTLITGYRALAALEAARSATVGTSGIPLDSIVSEDRAYDELPSPIPLSPLL